MTVGIAVMEFENLNHQMLSMVVTSIQPVKPKTVSDNWVQMVGMTLCVLEHGPELRNIIFRWVMFVKCEHSIHLWSIRENSKRLFTHGPVHSWQPMLL